MAKYIKKIRDFSAGLEEVANDNMSENALMTARNVVPGDTYGIARASGTVTTDYGQATGSVVVYENTVQLSSGSATISTIPPLLDASYGTKYLVSINGYETSVSMDDRGALTAYDRDEKELVFSCGASNILVTYDATSVDLKISRDISGYPVVLLTELALPDDVTQIIAFVKVDNISWSMLYYDTEWHVAVSSADSVTMRPVRDWFVYAGAFYWLDGQNFRRWTGTEIQNLAKDQSSGSWYMNLSGAPTSDLITSFYEKICTAVAVEQRSTRWFFATKDNEVIFSAVGSPESFTYTSILNISSGQADNITALHEFNSGLLIFQKRSVYYLQGYDLAGASDVELNKLNVSCGTEWPETVKTVENAVLFMGDNGLYRLSIPYYSTSIAARNVSDKRISKRLTDEKAKGFAAAVYNNIYYLTKMTDHGNYEYRYYTTLGSFWGEYTQNPYCYAPRLAGAEELYIGCDNGYVLKYDDSVYHYINTETGGASVIPIEVVTKGYDVVGNMVQNSKIKKVFVLLKQYEKESTAFTIQMKLDYKDYSYAYAYDASVDSVEDVWNAIVHETTGDESLVWEEGKFAQGYWGWLDTVTKAFSVNSKCKRAQFTFRDNSLDNPLLLYGIALLYKQKKVKGSRLGITEAEIAYND